MSHINSGSQNITVSLVSISVVLGSQAFRASTGCRLYVSRIPHADDKTDNLYNGVSMWVSANYLIHA